MARTAGKDKFAHAYSGGQQPPAYAEKVDISSADFTPTMSNVRGFVMDALGALVVVTAGGDTVTFTSGTYAAGMTHPLQIKTVVKAGTGSQAIYLLGDA